MDDVLGHVVLSIGDEDLLAEQAVGPVVGPLRARPHRIEVGAGLGLGQVHRAGPAAGDHRLEIDVEQVLRAIGLERADRAFGEERAEGEGHRGAVPDLGAGDVDEVRQRHAAELGRRGNPAPARLGPAAIGVGEAGRRGHGPIGVNRAHGVGGAVQRRDLLGGETPGLGDDRGDRLPVELPVKLCADELRQARNRLQREQDIGDRGSIGHESSSASFWRRRAGLIGQSQSRLKIDQILGRARRKDSMATHRVTQRAPATPETIAAAAECLRLGGLVAMPTETVYGLAADATSDQAVAEIYAAKGRPAFNPLIAHVLGAEDALEHARLDGGGGAARARLLAGAADPGRAGRAGLPGQPARAGRARHAGAARAGPSGRPRPDRGRRSAARRALGQSIGPCQRDDGRPRAGRPRRPDRLGPRRRPVAARRRIRRSSPASRRVRRCCARAPSPAEALEAALGRPLAQAAAARAAPQAPGQLASHYAPRARLRLDARAVARRRGGARFRRGAGGRGFARPA